MFPNFFSARRTALKQMPIISQHQPHKTFHYGYFQANAEEMRDTETVHFSILYNLQRIYSLIL